MNSKDSIINVKRPFYLSNTFIIIAACLWFAYGTGIIIAIVMSIFQKKYDIRKMQSLHEVVSDEVNTSLQLEIKKVHNELDQMKRDAENECKHITDLIQRQTIKKNENQEIIESLNDELIKLDKQKEKLQTKVSKLKPAIKAVKESIQFYRINNQYTELDKEIHDLMYPSVELPLHSYDVKVLKQKSNTVKKHISEMLIDYERRYKTKANKSIYSLMVIALQAELQNVLINLKYDKLDNTKNYINEIAMKYIDIAGKGNQSIYSTLVKFIGELESLFLQLADIEYEYFIKREQQKEEQRLIREQMAQEAAERKLLKEQQKKVEQEEQKYHQEIDNLKSQLLSENDHDALRELKLRIDELTIQLNAVEEKKEEISNLQNGKAGTVYIISNIGSFGSDTFKIGMTRRLEPNDRIKELSSASVPFPFDVHSTIFSDNAPGLENKMHKLLHDKRVNKVNIRKEFFKTSIDDLEELVNTLDPTAEFKRTLVSYEYQKTLEILKSSVNSNVS